MSKHRRFERSDNSNRDGNDELSKASLEANADAKPVLKNMPECPTDGKFLTLVPYIYDYCDAYVKNLPPEASSNSVKIQVPLPFGRPFEIHPKRLVNNGNSMVDKIGLGKSGFVECDYNISEGTIKFDRSLIQLHSTVAPYLGKKEKPFYFDREPSTKQTFMIFNNPTPKQLREWLRADPRDVIVKDLSEEAGTPYTKEASSTADQLSKRKKQ